MNGPRISRTPGGTRTRNTRIGCWCTSIGAYEPSICSSWLELKPDAKTAVYFNEDVELSMLTQEGTTQLLLESIFARRLDMCCLPG